MTVAGRLNLMPICKIIYLAYKYRGMGIAQQLIQQVNQTAQQRECDRVYWLTHEDNYRHGSCMIVSQKEQVLFNIAALQQRCKTRMHIFYKFIVSVMQHTVLSLILYLQQKIYKTKPH